jgi:sarcosine oxidase
VSGTSRYDAIVVGVGTIGSAALYELAVRRRRVLGIEQFSVAHERGSMHGSTRIIRLAYHEHPDYVPLLRRAYQRWAELETRSATRLLEVTGVVEVGLPDTRLIAGTLRACAEHELSYDLISTSELRRRFPVFTPEAGSVAVVQPQGGYLHAERCVETHVSEALAAGAELHLGERVVDWQAADGQVLVTTDRGRYEAERLVLSPGAWAPRLLRLPELALVPERQLVAWFRPLRQPERFAPERLPVFIVEEDGCHYYGFPAIDEAGVKLGRMHYPGDQVTDPDSYARDVTPGELEPLRAFLARRLPDAAGGLTRASACLFTNAPDGHFIVDRHPQHPEVVVASVCSGHGFKFSPVIGELLADLACYGVSPLPAGFLGLDRFAAAAG